MDKVEAQIRVILRTENFSKMDQPPGTVLEDEEEGDAAANIPTLPSANSLQNQPSLKSKNSSLKNSGKGLASTSGASSAKDLVVGKTSQNDERPSWERPEKEAPDCGCTLS